MSNGSKAVANGAESGSNLLTSQAQEVTPATTTCCGSDRALPSSADSRPLHSSNPRDLAARPETAKADRSGSAAVADSLIAEMLEVLEAVAEELDNRADVVDGSYGVPKPNWAMRLLQDVDAVIAKAEGRK